MPGMLHVPTGYKTTLAARRFAADTGEEQRAGPAPQARVSVWRLRLAQLLRRLVARLDP